MSLYRQLWAAISLLMFIAVGGSLLLSSLSVKRGLEEQLAIKNIDNANNLAIAAGQVADDPTLIKLLLSAQFDNGHYQFIGYRDPEGAELLSLNKPLSNASTPRWFRNLMQLEAPAGTAELLSGWTQSGTIQVASDPTFAYQALWQTSLRLLAYFFFGIVVFGVVGHLLLRRITHPLHAVVEQSKAMRERRFTRVSLPKTLEFRELVTAMNDLSDTIQVFFDRESGRLKRIQQESETDPISGTASREHFLGAAASYLLASPDSNGWLMILRIQDLQGLNRSKGRKAVDTLLKQLGLLLSKFTDSSHDMTGRLNGSDFALFLTGIQPDGNVVREIHKAAMAKLQELEFHSTVTIHAAAYQFMPGDVISDILNRTDHALAVAETHSVSTLEIAQAERGRLPPQDREFWQNFLDHSLSSGAITIEIHPTVSDQNEILHLNIEPYCSLKEGTASSYQLRSWAARLDQGHDLDEFVLNLAAKRTDRINHPMAFSLSSQSLQKPESIVRALVNNESLSERGVHIEIPEYLAVQNFRGFKHVVNMIRPFAKQIGLSYAGHHVESIGQIYDSGISYIVLDSTLTLDIEDSERNQIMIRSLATLFHSIGIKVYGAGITSAAQWELLCGLGLDGGQGSHFDTLITKD